MKIGFIGMGNMAGAIAKGILKHEAIDAKDVYVFDIEQEKLKTLQAEYKVNLVEDEVALVENADMIVLGVKPNIVEKVLSKIKDTLDNKSIVSMVAGYNYEQFVPLVSSSTRHLTIMPNTPAMVSTGMTLFEEKHSLTKEEFNFVTTLFNSIGEVKVLPTYQMAAGSAISGCGPAFLYMMIESLADGGVLAGLPRDVAYYLASQTMIGAGTMQKETKIHPGVLKDNVCSPGGITIKGVQALEDGGFRSTVMAAINKTIK